MDNLNILPQGLWPVMLTPFLENNKVDTEGLRRLTDFYITSGVSGLFSNCLSSEMYQLNNRERLSIIKTVVDQSKDQVPVVATGTFSRNTSEAADFIKQVFDTGVTAVIIISSVLVDIDEDDEIFKNRLEEIMDKTGNISLGLYECPLPYRRLIKPEMMSWLAGTGRFIYHKDTSCNNQQIKEKLEAIKGSNFKLFNADTPTALASLLGGARGISPISANFFPELFSFLLDQFYRDGINEDVKHLNSQLVVMDKINHCFYPYAAKWFLQKRGLKISTTTRTTYEAMAPADIIRLEAVFDVFQNLSKYFEIELSKFADL